MIRCSSTLAIVSRLVKAVCARPRAAALSGGRFSAFFGMAALVLLAAAPANAANEPSLSLLLDRVGEQTGKFWDYFPSVTCTETLTQNKLGDKGKVLFQQRETFDYLIMLRSRGLDISVDESRVETAHTRSKNTASLLETNGFSLFTLIFHNNYQSHYQFRQLPDESVNGRRLLHIAFQQVSNDHPLSVLQLGETEYPLEWRGTAWIDPDSSAVARIHAGLGDSLTARGLLRLEADVTYSDIHFSGSPSYSLPVSADIEAETKRQHWHNTHQFSNYKRFSVDTDVKLSPVR